MSDTYFDLPSRLEDSFPEIDSDIVTDLRKNNEEYAEIQQQISELKKQFPCIMNALSSEGKLVITITHDMEFVAENFDRTVCMADKHILMDDKTNRILTDDSLMEKAALKKPNVSYLASEMGFEGVITSEDFLAALTENSKRL